MKSSIEYPTNDSSLPTSLWMGRSFKNLKIFFKISLAGIIWKLVKSIKIFKTNSVLEGYIIFIRGMWVINYKLFTMLQTIPMTVDLNIIRKSNYKNAYSRNEGTKVAAIPAVATLEREFNLPISPSLSNWLGISLVMTYRSYTVLS